MNQDYKVVGREIKRIIGSLTRCGKPTLVPQWAFPLFRAAYQLFVHHILIPVTAVTANGTSLCEIGSRSWLTSRS